MTNVCFLFLVKRPIILLLCGSKIAWDSYAPQQMISENFQASGRSLNHVEKPSSFVEFEHARNQRLYWILNAARPWELVQ